jgi:hypothetical protein
MAYRQQPSNRKSNTSFDDKVRQINESNALPILQLRGLIMYDALPNITMKIHASLHQRRDEPKEYSD